ncbi:class I SAM-dependent methyltransferase [Phycicoccus flavus]|uniref:Methyltransferase domain-containing protein n=1 Tax=Phycicoccus flavus TaxID=2502783 RepID=A0A8T6R662_9MICO|nr:methyltransferase domain-containing protein [Phycicoccus flavus]
MLDLGCGTGRIADPLALEGHDVLAVDESADMLAEVQHARTLCASIGSLSLDTRFDVVLLLSHLINGTDGEELLEVAAKHVTGRGSVLVQRLEPGRDWRPGAVIQGDVTISLDSIRVSGSIIEATTEYVLGERSWRQPWRMRVIDDAELSAMTKRLGLTIELLDGAWVLLRPAT